MGRALKFRAYIKSENSYREIRTIAYGYDGQLEGVWTYRKIWDDKVYFGVDEVILEQYTGLKDKNGKEIYEGDIIQEEVDFSIKMADGAFRYEVYWDSDMLTWSLNPLNAASVHAELWETNMSREIISNIHENPDYWRTIEQ